MKLIEKWLREIGCGGF